jgi:hypothetical protein
MHYTTLLSSAIAPLLIKKIVTCYLDETPRTSVCCHAKVVIFTHGNRPTLKDLAPLKAVATSNERLTPKLYEAVWRLMVNFNTPLATPTCHVKKALLILENMKVALNSLLVLPLTDATCELVRGG